MSNSEETKAFIEACKCGVTEFVEFMLKNPKVNPACDNNLPIMIASQNGFDGVVKLLLTCPTVDPSTNDNYSLKNAAQYGHVETVRLLLTNPKVDPSTGNGQPLRNAISNKHLRVAKLIIQDGRIKMQEVIKALSANSHFDHIETLMKIKDEIAEEKMKELAKPVKVETPKEEEPKEKKNRADDFKLAMDLLANVFTELNK